MNRYCRHSILIVIVISLLLTSANLPLQTVFTQDTTKENHLLMLKYGVIDTSSGEPPLSVNLRLEGYPPGQPGYYLVQFADVILPEWRADLESTGAEIMGYVPNNAYLVRMTNETRSQVINMVNVQWIGIYQPAYRISEDLSSLASEPPIVITVLTFPDAGLDMIVGQIKELGAEILAADENHWQGTLRILSMTKILTDIANINGVMWIEPWYEPELTNDVARGTMDVRDTVWTTQGLYGAGQIVAIADTGLDVGMTGAEMSDDFEGRIHAVFARGRTATNDWSDPNGHGTHVAGSVLGNGRNSGSNPANHDYANSYAGIAPEAEMVFQSTLAGDGSLDGIPNDLTQLFQQAFDNGARIHSNSWGNTSGWGNYTAWAFQADQFVWDHPEMVILFAAGNNGVDANSDGVVDQDSVSPPATAKNVITVGASENLRPAGGLNCQWGTCWPPTRFPANPIHDDWISSNFNGMAAFSSRGPVDVSRIKPDVVAPGTNILSSRTHQYSAAMDAESGAGTWTALAPWTITTTNAYAGTHSWTTGSYGINLDVSLTSPIIDIRTGADTISYFTTYSVASGDSVTLEYWDGTTWVLCHTFSGNQANWVHRSCLLPVERDHWNDTQKQNFRFRFRLQSDASVTSTGWSVDDILVTPHGWSFETDAGVPNPDYLYMGGTSMATPLVAGGAALVREYYTDRSHTPSAALVKATLISGAADPSPGQYGGGTTREIGARPNSVSGWGRVNLQESLFPTTPTNFLYQDLANAAGLNTNETRIYRYQVRDASVPFRATLVWSDFPRLPLVGSGGGINNDLDIEVRTPSGTTLYPNELAARDGSNNVEDVFIPAANMQTGVYSVTIRGHNIPTGPQGFGLVVRGGNVSRAINIAVTPAHYDNIGAILTIMGYPWTRILDSTLNNYANIAQYDVIYANCSAAALSNGPMAANSLRQFVQNGGSFYASDYAYAYVTNAFQSFVTFFGSDPRIGSIGSVTGRITDPGLASYLNPNAPPSTISLNYNLGMWVVVDTVPSQTTVHIRGDIPTSQGTLYDKPLVVSFSPYANSTGRVIYTTFHNEAQQSDIEKKLLEYLVLIPVSSKISNEAQEMVRNNGVSVKQVNIGTINQGITSAPILYNLTKSTKLVYVLNWSGSTLRMTLTRPNGSLYTQVESSTPPLTIVIPDAEAGRWKYQVMGVNVPYGNYPYVVAIGDNNPVGGRNVHLPLVLRVQLGGSNPSPTPTSTPTRIPTNTPIPTPTPTPTPTNLPPNVPSNPSPSDGALEQAVNALLAWEGGDPDGDEVIYDVYLANDSTPDVLVCTGVVSTFCQPAALNYNSQYYWRVVARDEHGATQSGPVWSFGTVVGILDQHQDGNNYGFLLGADSARWQEFVPSLNKLSAIDLYVADGGDAGNLIIEIRDLADTVLAQKMIMQSDVGGWMRVDFDSILTLTPGAKYRIAVRTDQPPLVDKYFWLGSTESTYNPDCSNDVSGGWPNYDYTFRTYGY